MAEESGITRRLESYRVAVHSIVRKGAEPYRQMRYMNRVCNVGFEESNSSG